MVRAAPQSRPPRPLGSEWPTTLSAPPFRPLSLDGQRRSQALPRGVHQVALGPAPQGLHGVLRLHGVLSECDPRARRRLPVGGLHGDTIVRPPLIPEARAFGSHRGWLPPPSSSEVSGSRAPRSRRGLHGRGCQNMTSPGARAARRPGGPRGNQPFRGVGTPTQSPGRAGGWFGSPPRTKTTLERGPLIPGAAGGTIAELAKLRTRPGVGIPCGPFQGAGGRIGAEA